MSGEKKEMQRFATDAVEATVTIITERKGKKERKGKEKKKGGVSVRLAAN